MQIFTKLLIKMVVESHSEVISHFFFESLHNMRDYTNCPVSFLLYARCTNFQKSAPSETLLNFFLGDPQRMNAVLNCSFLCLISFVVE